MNAKILKAQRIEITEYYLYKKISKIVRDKRNREIIERMAAQEKSHYELWKQITKKNIRPSYFYINFYYYLTRIFGISFGLKLLERGESLAIKLYADLKGEHPELAKMVKEEQEHEERLLGLINSRHLENVGSIILGLNDALVELTGALAGFTLALGNTRIIAIVGLITGIAASFSMAASSYLAAKEEKHKNAFVAGITTGVSYIITVTVLVTPYFLVQNPFVALAATLILAIFIIFLFNFYTSIARNISFKKKFAEMALISLGTATINFGIGYAVKRYFGL